MNQINKSRLIGGSVIAFAVLLFTPAILTPKEHDLSNPTLAVSIDNTKPSNLAVSADNKIKQVNTATSQNIPIPAPPALKLESVPVAATPSATSPATKSSVGNQKTAKPVAVALTKKSNPQTVTAKAATKKNSSWLRVGSFSSTKNANNLLKTLTPKNSAKVEKTTVNGVTFYRVLVGPFNNKETLETAKKSLTKAGFSPSIQR